MHKCIQRLVVIAAGAVAAFCVIAVTASPAALAGLIPLTSVEGFPNGRTSNDIPANAIDGDITTWTWTTEHNNTIAPSYLAIGFSSTEVDRIRLWKSADGGGGNNAKNLIIQYTTDTGALDSRTWITVTDLLSGYLGTELWTGVVNSNGTVTNDTLESSITGWGSLTFDAINATGIRIGFSNPNPLFNFCNGVTIDQTCNHYRVAEFEAFDSPISAAVPEPSSLALIGTGIAGLAIARRRRKVAERFRQG